MLQVWDGDHPVMPQVILEAIPKTLHLYRNPFEPELPDPDETASNRGMLSAKKSRRKNKPDPPSDALKISNLGGVEGRLLREATPGGNIGNSLMREIRMHPSFKEVVRRCEMRRSELVRPLHAYYDLRKEPRLYYLGNPIFHHNDLWQHNRIDGYAAKDVQDLMQLTPEFETVRARAYSSALLLRSAFLRQPADQRARFLVRARVPQGWIECTLDLALNRAADYHLASLRYNTSYIFNVKVEAAEISQPATEDAPFGLAPSTYVQIEHGGFVRCSQVERETRTPTFEWMSGPIPFDHTETLKLKLLMTKTADKEVDPSEDMLVGQAWLPAPVLPLPRGLRAPEIFPLSLGTNVGIIHLTIEGPSLRRSAVKGCVCNCCCCTLPICGSPPCLPAMSVVYARGSRNCWSCLTSDECKKVLGILCCCVVTTAAVTVASRTPAGASAIGMAQQAPSAGMGLLTKGVSSGLL